MSLCIEIEDRKQRLLAVRSEKGALLLSQELGLIPADPAGSSQMKEHFHQLSTRASRQARVWGLLLLGTIMLVAILTFSSVPTSPAFLRFRFLLGGVGIVVLVVFAFWGGLATAFWLSRRSKNLSLQI